MRISCLCVCVCVSPCERIARRPFGARAQFDSIAVRVECDNCQAAVAGRAGLFSSVMCIRVCARAHNALAHVLDPSHAVRQVRSCGALSDRMRFASVGRRCTIRTERRKAFFSSALLSNTGNRWHVDECNGLRRTFKITVARQIPALLANRAGRLCTPHLPAQADRTRANVIAERSRSGHFISHASFDRINCTE